MDVLKVKVLRHILDIKDRGYIKPNVSRAGEIAKFIRAQDKKEQDAWLILFGCLCSYMPAQVSRYEAGMKELLGLLEGVKPDAEMAMTKEEMEALLAEGQAKEDEGESLHADLVKSIVGEDPPEKDMEDLHQKALEGL